MKIGILGTGHIGATVARKLAAAGHTVKVANSRGADTLTAFAAEIGATAASAVQAVTGVDAIVLSIPLARLPDIAALLAGVPDEVVVIDTSNYYPARDGHIAALDAGEVEGLWVSAQIGRPVVKAWNAILWGSLADKGRPAGRPGRIALPVAGDDPAAKRIASELVDATGFDAVDAGPLADSWRIQPGNPAFCTDLSAEQLRQALPLADRRLAPRRRDLGIEAIGLFGEHTSNDILHLYRALTKSSGRGQQ